MGVAPLGVVRQVLELARLMNREPPPAPDQMVKGDQWTVMWKDDTQSILLMVEEGAAAKAEAYNDAFRATNQRAEALRDQKRLQTNLAGYTDPAVIKVARERLEEIETKIAKCEDLIAKDLIVAVTERKWTFPLSEVV